MHFRRLPFFPWLAIVLQHSEIKTRLSPAEVSERFDRLILKTSGPFVLSPANKFADNIANDPREHASYYGDFAGRTFSVYGRVSTSRMYRPVILGLITEEDDHTQVVRLSFGPDVAAILAVLVFAAGGVAVCQALGSVIGHWIVFAVLGVAWTLLNICLVVWFSALEKSTATSRFRDALG